MVACNLFLFILALLSFSAHSQSGDNIKSIEASARAQADKKNWPKVIELLNAHTDEAPTAAFLLLASAYHEQNDFANMVRILGLLAEKRPSDPLVLYMLGDARLKLSAKTTEAASRLKIEDAAIEDFRNSIRLRRNLRIAHQALVNYFAKTGQNLEAREQLVEMIRVFGPRPELQADLCRIYASDGFLPQAVKSCLTAIKQNRAESDSFMYLAQAYFDQKEIKKAEKAVTTAAKRFPENEFIQYGAGQFYITQSNFPVAAKYFQRAVANDANTVRSQRGLAISLFESGQVEAALPHYMKACSLDSSTQEGFELAASKLRLKNSGALAQKYAQSFSACGKRD